MRRVAKFFLEFALLATLITILTQFSAFAAENLPFLQQTVDIYIKGQIPGPADPKSINSIETLKTLVLVDILGYVKIIVAVIGILYITIAGARLVMQGDNEETATTAKKAITYIILAFVMISMSQEFAKIFDMGNKTLIQTPSEILKRVKLFDQDVKVIITFIKYLLGAFATLMIVRAGIKMVTKSGDEEEMGKQKTAIALASAGLVLTYLGGIFIDKVFYRVDKEVYTGISGIQISTDPAKGVSEIVGITNFIVSFVGPIAVLALMAAALMYITAGGEEGQTEKAKRILIATVIGIAIIYGAFAIVSTVVAGKLPTPTA